MSNQSQIHSLEFEGESSHHEHNVSDLYINRSLQAEIAKIVNKYRNMFPDKHLSGVNNYFFIDKKQNNYDFHAKIVELIVSGGNSKRSNIDITAQVQEFFPDEVVNKNIWSKLLSSKMKKSLGANLDVEIRFLLEKAKTLSEFKKKVWSHLSLKSDGLTYSANIFVNSVEILVNGVSFGIKKTQLRKKQKNTTTHTYDSILIGFIMR